MEESSHIRIHVTPNSKKDLISEKNGTFEIMVREPAERGLANKRVLEILREKFGRDSSVRMVAGSKSSHKTVLISKRKKHATKH